MTISEKLTDERVSDVRFDEDSLVVDLMDGRTISVPIAWFPKLAGGTSDERSKWITCAGGLGIHWPELDEDLSTAGLLRGTKAPAPSAA